MAWTAPRTWVAGELVTAALLNTHVRDNLTEIRSYHPYVLFSANGALANNTTNPTNVYSRTVAANTLVQNGYGLRILYRGVFAGNGNTKSIDFKFGGSTYYSFSSAINGGQWYMDSFIHRVTSSDVRCWSRFTSKSGGGTVTPDVGAATVSSLSFAGSLVLVVTLTATSTSDIIINEMKVELVQGDPAVV